MILSVEPLPFPGEFLCAALTTSELPVNHAVEDDHWVEGGQPPDEESYCSPWLLGTLKSGQIQFTQGSLTTEFVDRITDDALDYLDGSRRGRD
ncbi:hypothetical protein [Halorussus amylolyticus]|uniref:hypothetical protein n=1 Tax=Halorussus amylolyticus TaxID=1126242 RepID=UPI00192F13DA|nr:hypothetical protein [Halorussus amylolyticus]